MAKQKVGLHKQVSEIFDGVPIPKEAGPHEPVKTLLSNRLDFLRPTRCGSRHQRNLRHPRGCHSTSTRPSLSKSGGLGLNNLIPPAR
jgi:hypothetical protein